MNYLALFRGINVGGNKKVSMQELKESCMGLGFTNVTTILNTGNIVFKSDQDKNAVEKSLSELLKDNYDFQIPSLVFGGDELTQFIENDKVQHLINSVEKGQKIIFTFARDLKASEMEALKNTDEFSVVHWNNSMLCLHFSVDQIGTPVIMKALDSALKKRGTSRNLNTIKKIIKKLEEL